jgi:hypothetical protein
MYQKCLRDLCLLLRYQTSTSGKEKTRTGQRFPLKAPLSMSRYMKLDCNVLAGSVEDRMVIWDGISTEYQIVNDVLAARN